MISCYNRFYRVVLIDLRKKASKMHAKNTSKCPGVKVTRFSYYLNIQAICSFAYLTFV